MSPLIPVRNRLVVPPALLKAPNPLLLDLSLSNLSVPGTVVNPTIRSPWGFQEGAYYTNLNTYPYATMVAYPMNGLPAGIPAHSTLTTPVLCFTANDADSSQAGHPTSPYQGVHSPGPNVSVSLNTPASSSGGIFYPGGLFYMGWSYMLDATFPDWPNNNVFFQMMECFSPPFGGANIGMGVLGTNQGVPRMTQQSWQMQVGSNPPTANWVWSAPVVKGVWTDFVVGINFSTDPTIGTVELWMNGVKQTFNGGTAQTPTGLGTQTLHAATKAANTNGFYLDHYRSGNFGSFAPQAWTRTWMAGAKIGRTYASVTPS